MSNLTTLSISADHTTVSIGPSRKWGDVYEYLQAYDRSGAGGRLAPVGVPGLLLAGGINFYGNQHGFSADMVTEYEVVLANGEVVDATKYDYSDLFWALKGGSSNFGIVTKFVMRTVPSKEVWAGVYTVADQYIPDFLAVSTPSHHAILLLRFQGYSKLFGEYRRSAFSYCSCRCSPEFNVLRWLCYPLLR